MRYKISNEIQSAKHCLFSTDISETSILDYYHIQQGQHNNFQHYFVLACGTRGEEEKRGGVACQNSNGVDELIHP